MLRNLRPRTAYDVMAAIAFVATVAGGTAYAAATIGPGDIKRDAVLTRHINDGAVKSPDLGPDSVRTSKIADAQVFPHDLSGEARTRKVEYKRPHKDGVKHTVLRLGNLRLRARCRYEENVSGPQFNKTILDLYATNVGTKTGELNTGYVRWQAGQGPGPGKAYTDGRALEAGVEDTINTEANLTDPLLTAYPNSHQDKAVGQLVLRTPGRVTSVTFHATALADVSCELHGTAVTATG